jgi:hypothetical protein
MCHRRLTALDFSTPTIQLASDTSKSPEQEPVLVRREHMYRVEPEVTTRRVTAGGFEVPTIAAKLRKNSEGIPALYDCEKYGVPNIGGFDCSFGPAAAFTIRGSRLGKTRQVDFVI